jgi:multiple sugar transport system substrate-binding protein
MAAAACSSSSTGGSSPVPTVTGAAASAVAPLAASGKLPSTTLSICLFAGPELDTLRALSPQFTKYTKGKVKFNFVPIPTESSNQGTLTQLKSGSSSCDIVDQSSSNAGLINQYLQPFNGYMKQPSLFNSGAYDINDFPAGLLALSQAPQGLVSLPYGSDTPLLMYRADLMRKWGIQVPQAPKAWSWAQLYAAVTKIKQKLASHSAGDPQFPIAVGGASSVSGAIFALQAMWSAGGDPLGADGKSTDFTQPAAVAGLQKSVGLSTDLKATSPGTASYDYAELQTALEQNRVAMAIEWNAAAADLDNPATSPKTAGKMAYGMLPYSGSGGPSTKRSFLSTHALAINKASKNKDAAFEFAVWYTSKPIAHQYVASGADSSGRRSLLGDPSLAKSQPQLAALNDSLALAHSLPAGPYLPDMLTGVIGPNSNAAYADTTSVPAAMSAMQSAAKNLLQKAGH